MKISREETLTERVCNYIRSEYYENNGVWLKTDYEIMPYNAIYVAILPPPSVLAIQEECTPPIDSGETLIVLHDCYQFNGQTTRFTIYDNKIYIAKFKRDTI